MKKYIFIELSGFFLILFVGFSYIVQKHFLRSFDFNTTVRLQNHTPLSFDSFFSVLSVLGRVEYVAIFLIIILIFHKKIWGAIVFVIFAGGHVIELFGKTFINQPPPPHMFLRSQYSTFPGLYVSTQDSYPSGHAFRAIFLAVTLTYIIWTSKKLPPVAKALVLILVFGYTAIMLYSRITLGEHWTTDVIGGALWGFACSFISLLFI